MMGLCAASGEFQAHCLIAMGPGPCLNPTRAMAESCHPSTGGGAAGEEDADEQPEEDADNIPFACGICRGPFLECLDPIVTRCRHYFCEECALRHNVKDKTCALCQMPTGGAFHTAHEIVKRTKRIKAAEKAEGEEGPGGASLGPAAAAGWAEVKKGPGEQGGEDSPRLRGPGPGGGGPGISAGPTALGGWTTVDD